MENNATSEDAILYVTDQLRTARFVADQQSLHFLVYLIDMAMLEGKSYLAEATWSKAARAVPSLDGDRPHV